MKLKVNFQTRGLLTLILVVAISSFAFAQRTITGTATDADGGDPLISATVIVVGTSSGTITDFDGNYSLEAPEGATELEFSYTGYATQKVAIGTSNIVDVVLSAGSILDEIVVTGYGTSKRSDLTGAISSLSEKNFNQGIVLAPDQLIQGKIPGVQMTNNSGQPGGSTTLRIRGNNSIRAGSDPLYVVDGVPLDGRSARPTLNSTGLGNTPPTNPLNFISTIDIASIDILKDASASAIYGSRGANGVVLITTKKGVPGAPVVEFNAAVGTSSILKKYDVLSASEYRSALSDYGLTGVDDGGDVDAFDEISQSGTTQDYSLAIGGGTERSNYRISLNYLDQEGIIKESGIQKYTASVRGGFTLLNSKRLKLDYSILASQTKEDVAPISTDAGATSSLIGQALQWNPTTPLVNADGSLNVLKGSSIINPVAGLASFDDQADITTLLARISPSYQILDDLVYRFTFSVNQSQGERSSQNRSFINVQGVEDRGVAFAASQKLLTTQYTHTLNYNTEVADNIGLDLLLGYEYLKFTNQGFIVGASDFGFDVIDYTDYLQGSSQGSRFVRSFNDPDSELQSYFARANFNLNDKFLITGTVRADGSSKFGDNNEYGVFPSVAAAYKLDDVMPDAFDNLKVRVGWGQVGNQEFPAGSALTRFIVTDGGGVTRENAQNADLKWETTSTFNVGIDFALYNYKVSGTVEFFNKSTEDLLFNSPLAAPSPETTIWKNLSDGKVVNQGIELGLNAYIVDNDRFTWNIGLAATFLTNELKDYTGPTIQTGGLFGQGISGATVQQFTNGQPLGVFFTREHTEIGEDGQSVYVDGEALAFAGDPNPNALIGLSSYITSGNLDFSFAFNGAFGHQLYNNTANTVIPIGNLGSLNIDAGLLGRGNQEALSNAVKASDRYIESGDFLKLTNATIGYRFKDLAGIKNLRVFLTGQNLLVLTSYSGFDPEVNTVNLSSNGVPSLGIEYIPYPTARTFLFGVNVSF